MGPSGGGGAEVHLYQRPSYGVPLVRLAALELAAAPRPAEVGADPPELDGELGRSAGMYIALVQGGQVVDVAQLVPYGGQPADAEDEAQDYWETASNTSDDEWLEAPPRAARAFEYRLSSSSEEDHEASSDGVAGEHSPSVSRSKSNEDIGEGGSSNVDDDDDTDEGDDGEEAEAEDKDEDGDDDDTDEGDDGEEAEAEDKDEDDDEEDEEDTEADDEDEAGEEMKMKVVMMKRGSGNVDDDDDTDEGDDGEGAEAEDKDEDDDEEDEEDAEAEDEDEAGEEMKMKMKERLKLILRIWPAKSHTRLKIFSGIKWFATKVYHLTWLNHHELEELFESSFKMDIGAPVAATTVFRMRDCVMDFEADVLHTAKFDQLITEFEPSVLDFKFCLKLGGEQDCRVFKCLLNGHKFALKTIRLKEFCNREPREVNVISSLKDKHVMKFYQGWIEPWTYKQKDMANYLFIQLELCESTLKNMLLPENFDSIDDRRYLSEEIAKGLKSIHSEFIVHRDLKPDNIFFGFDMGVRIGDFGDACIDHDESGGYGGTPSLGTQYYSAPELESAEKITPKADTYSAGVIFLEIFTRFGTLTERHHVLKGLREDGVPDDSCDMVVDPQGARGLVKRMTAAEPTSRPSDSEILGYFQQ